MESGLPDLLWTGQLKAADPDISHDLFSTKHIHFLGLAIDADPPGVDLIAKREISYQLFTVITIIFPVY
jgi:hypothetical protein